MSYDSLPEAVITMEPPRGIEIREDVIGEDSPAIVDALLAAC